MKKEWQRPKLVVSACLNKEKCRYNGEDSPCKMIDELLEYIDIVTICPESEIGLKTPRNTIRLVGEIDNFRVVEPESEDDLTDKMLEFAKRKLLEFKDMELDGFIFKSRSPSCGTKDVKIYKTMDRGSMSVKGQGFFTKFLRDEMPECAIEDDGRLRSFEIRDNFYTKIFTLAEFDKVKKDKNKSELVNFHTNNKLLFQTYSQDKTRELGAIVAGISSDNIDTVIESYEKMLKDMLKEYPRFKRAAHVFLKAYGYIADGLSQEEKEFFKETLEEFKVGKQSKKSIITLLKSYAIRFNNEYLLKQSILEPYPEKLLNLDDSGKGIVR